MEVKSYCSSIGVALSNEFGGCPEILCFLFHSFNYLYHIVFFLFILSVFCKSSEFANHQLLSKINDRKKQRTGMKTTIFVPLLRSSKTNQILYLSLKNCKTYEKNYPVGIIIQTQIQFILQNHIIGSSLS